MLSSEATRLMNLKGSLPSGGPKRKPEVKGECLVGSRGLEFLHDHDSRHPLLGQSSRSTMASTYYYALVLVLGETVPRCLLPAVVDPSAS